MLDAPHGAEWFTVSRCLRTSAEKELQLVKMCRAASGRSAQCSELSVATKTCMFQGCGKSMSMCDCQSRYYSEVRIYNGVCSTWYY